MIIYYIQVTNIIDEYATYIFNRQARCILNIEHISCSVTIDNAIYIDINAKSIKRNMMLFQ